MEGFVSTIILARLSTSEDGNRGLEAPEEPNRLERPVAPSRCDAVMQVVWTIVMRGMMRPSQNQSEILKHAYRWRRRRPVRPLVNLIRQHSHSAESEAEDRHRRSRYGFERNGHQRK